MRLADVVSCSVGFTRDDREPLTLAPVTKQDRAVPDYRLRAEHLLVDLLPVEESAGIKEMRFRIVKEDVRIVVETGDPLDLS
jgi:hypothetical protein